jgi:hypothetical protein
VEGVSKWRLNSSVLFCLEYKSSEAQLHPPPSLYIYFLFLDSFAKLRKTTISFIMSVRPHGTTRLPLDVAVPLQAWSGPEGSRNLRFPVFMTKAQDGGKVVSLTHRPPLPPGNTPGIHFCYRLSRPQGHSATGRIMSLKNSSDNIGNRTRDPPVCSVVP